MQVLHHDPKTSKAQCMPMCVHMYSHTCMSWEKEREKFIRNLHTSFFPSSSAANFFLAKLSTILEPKCILSVSSHPFLSNVFFLHLDGTALSYIVKF
jgi:hypothetical protein